MVRRPYIVGRNSHIENSFIGQYTSAGDGITIINSPIEYRMILETATLRESKGWKKALWDKIAKIW